MFSLLSRSQFEEIRQDPNIQGIRSMWKQLIASKPFEIGCHDNFGELSHSIDTLKSLLE